MTFTIQKLDERAMWLAHRWRRNPLVWAARLFTYSGVGLSWFVVIMTLMVATKLGVQLIPGQWAFMVLGLPALIARLTGTLLKRRIRRPRPTEKLLNYPAAVAVPKDTSFPSLHAASSVGFAAGMMMSGHPLAALVAGWAACVTLSRWYLGVHYPSDLVGGALLGTAFATLWQVLDMSRFFG